MLTATTGPWTFAASGASGSFVVNAPIYDESAIALYAVDPATGALYSPGYTTTLAADLTGATLIVASGLTAGHTVTVYRVPKQTQAQRLNPSGPLPTPVIERQLDRAFADIQALRAITERSLRLPLYEAAIEELGSALLRKNMVLGFDADGVPALLSNVPVSGAVTITAFMQTALGKSTAAALLTYLGASAFGQTLLALADAAALRTAAGTTYATAAEALAASSAVKVATPQALAGLWQTGTALASNATLDLTSGTTGYQRTIADAANAVATIQGTQPMVRLSAGADGVTLTHDAVKLISRTASDIVMRSGDSVTLLRIGVNQWREIDFEPVPNWRTAAFALAFGGTATKTHYLGQRVGDIRLFGTLKTGQTDQEWADTDFTGGKRMLFPSFAVTDGHTIVVGDTDVLITVSTSGLTLLQKTTRASAVIAPAKWDFTLEIDPRN